MAEFDLVITGGMVIDGTRMPRYQSRYRRQGRQDCQDRPPQDA